MPTIYQIIIIALLVAFIILLMNRTGARIKLRDFNDKIGISIIAEMLDCDFCLSFWLSVFITLIFRVLGYDISFLIPFCTTPIVRYLL